MGDEGQGFSEFSVRNDSDGGFRIVSGGSHFRNPYEMAYGKHALSGGSTSLPANPGGAYGSTVVAAATNAYREAARLGAGDLDPILGDAALAFGIFSVATKGAAFAEDGVHALSGTARGASPVKAYEVGLVSNLQSRSLNDALAIHHVPQQKPAGQAISGYNPAAGPGIAIPEEMHRRIPTLSATYGGTARELVARDLWNLRSHTDVPNSALRQLLALTRQMYPGALDK